MATCLESDVTTFAFGELPGFDESYSQNVLKRKNLREFLHLEGLFRTKMSKRFQNSIVTNFEHLNMLLIN